MSTGDGLTPGQRWYEKHKSEFSAKRKKRYRDDSEYRGKAVKRARDARAAKRKPLDAKYTRNAAEAAEEVGASVDSLRLWREKDYYPQPHEHGGKLYFTDKQVEQLRLLADFMQECGHRVRGPEREAQLGSIRSLVYANW